MRLIFRIQRNTGWGRVLRVGFVRNGCAHEWTFRDLWRMRRFVLLIGPVPRWLARIQAWRRR